MTTDGEARYPVWSPDGREIAYTVQDKGVWIVRRDGSRARPLHDADAARVPEEFTAQSWSPDEKRIAGTARGIVVYDVDARTYTRVSDFGERPVWRKGSLDLLFTHDDRVYHWAGAGEPRVIWATGPSRLSSGVTVADGGAEIFFAGKSSDKEIWIFDP